MDLNKVLAMHYSNIIKSIHPDAQSIQDIDHPSSMNHLLWTCDQINKGHEVKIDPSRWTGFVQGTLVTLGIIDLNDNLLSCNSSSNINTGEL